MNAIELMNVEHKNIKRMLKVVRQCCIGILNGKEMNFDDFNEIIYFVQNYADSHHHKKEEQVLFNKMIENLGVLADKIVKNGMLVEHDLGRLHIKELIAALDRVKAGDNDSKIDVIANAISYTHLLERHIDKEDNVIYTFAQRELDVAILENIDKECLDFEANNNEVKEKCLNILEKMEAKYMTA